MSPGFSFWSYMPDKAEFAKEMWVNLWPQLLNTPDSQASPLILHKLQKFKIADASPLEIYDFLVALSNEPVTELSAFMVQLFAVDKYYVRPGNETIS